MVDATFNYRIANAYRAFLAMDLQVGTPPVQIRAEAPPVIRDEDSAIDLSASVQGAITKDDARKMADSAVIQVANRLCYLWDYPFETPRFVADAYREKDDQGRGSVVVGIGQVLNISTKTSAVIRSPGQQLQDAKRYLEQPSHRGEGLFELYRSALLCTDPIARFLCLYSILLLTQGDTQGDVDAYIENLEKGVEKRQSQKPRAKPGDMETVYTSLRNDIGHRRQGLSIKTTREEMDRRLSGLKAIVKQAISEWP